MRAYEVARATGRPLTAWQKVRRPRPPLDARVLTVVLMPPRDALYRAIDARLDAMVAGGALDEAAAIEACGLDPRLPAAKALGVDALRRHVRGEIELAAALAAAKQASRNYAKRQMSWLRNQIVSTEVLNEKYSESVRSKIFPIIRNFLLTAQF
jgi:tRNA dimethylallyltransferase